MYRIRKELLLSTFYQGIGSSIMCQQGRPSGTNRSSRPDREITIGPNNRRITNNDLVGINIRIWKNINTYFGNDKTTQYGDLNINNRIILLERDQQRIFCIEPHEILPPPNKITVAARISDGQGIGKPFGEEFGYAQYMTIDTRGLHGPYRLDVSITITADKEASIHIYNELPGYKIDDGYTKNKTLSFHYLVYVLYFVFPIQLNINELYLNQFPPNSLDNYIMAAKNVLDYVYKRQDLPTRAICNNYTEAYKRIESGLKSLAGYTYQNWGWNEPPNKRPGQEALILLTIHEKILTPFVDPEATATTNKRLTAFKAVLSGIALVGATGIVPSALLIIATAAGYIFAASDTLEAAQKSDWISVGKAAVPQIISSIPKSLSQNAGNGLSFVFNLESFIKAMQADLDIEIPPYPIILERNMLCYRNRNSTVHPSPPLTETKRMGKSCTHKILRCSKCNYIREVHENTSNNPLRLIQYPDYRDNYGHQEWCNECDYIGFHKHSYRTVPINNPRHHELRCGCGRITEGEHVWEKIQGNQSRRCHECRYIDYHIHTVQINENLTTISRKYFGNINRIEEIATLNHLVSPFLIKVGEKLRIP